jgi:hypothetical protein
MKAIVIDKKHLTLVSHTNGVTVIEESGCIIDLDFQLLGSIFELADLGNTYTIKDCDEIESLKSNNELTELRNQIIGLINELNLRAKVISEKNEEIEQLKSDINRAYSNADRDVKEYNELYNRNKFLEDEISIVREISTKLEGDNNELKTSIYEKDELIKQLTDELNRRDKIIEDKTKRLIELENVEYELNKYRETNNALTEKLESKTIDLLDKASLYKYYRRAFRTVKEYLKPNEQYGFDSSGYNIINSINSKFIISFKNRSIASRAFNELRYSVSPRNVLVKYQKDIIEYNVDSMNIYFVESNTPNVVRKFHDECFSITCKDSYTAEIINILLNCGFDISGIMTVYKLYIAFSNIN